MTTRDVMWGLRGAATALALGALVARPVQAQRLADRVRAAGDATVRVAFAARPDVCGNGMGSISTRGGMRDDSDGFCYDGPVRVALMVRDGRVASLRTVVGGRWRPSESAVDLGVVSAPEAAAYLLDLAQHAEGRAAADAVLPAVLADSVTVWPTLLRIARDTDRPREARRQAVFWLGQAAGDRVAGALDDVARDGSVDREVREAAVFALSQRPRDESIPALIHVAQTSSDPEVRRKALFWLGQSNDPRALDVFEQILTRP